MSNDFLKARRNKKAQIGETMTWIVATIIIVFILSIFIYASSILAKTKNIGLFDSKISLDRDNDLIHIKNLFAFEKTSPEKKDAVKIWIENKNDE